MAGFDNKHASRDSSDHLSGKRGAPRRPRSLFVACLGSGGQVQGRTVDISRGGMLVEVRERPALPGEQPAGIIPFAARVADLYAEGMDAVFGDGAVKVRAKVVRVATHPTDPTTMRLGCRFDEGLTDSQCHLLGLDTSLSPDPALAIPLEDTAASVAPPPAPVAAAKTAVMPATVAAPAPQPRKVAEPVVAIAPPPAPKPVRAPAPAVVAPVEQPSLDGEVGDEPWGDELARIGRRNAAGAPRVRPMKVARGTILVHLFSRGGAMMGPRFVGVLSDVRGKSLVVDISMSEGETDAVSFGAPLGSHARAVCLRDGRVLWDVATRVDEVGQPDASAEVARITLIAPRIPPAALRRVGAAVAAAEAAHPVSPAA